MDQQPNTNSIRDYVPEKVLVTKLPNKEIAIHRPEPTPKLIVVSHTYHRDKNGRARDITCRSVRELSNRDDCIIREMIVGEEWVQLESAWIKDIGYLVIRNNGGKPFQVIPTPEQLQEAQSRIVEIGYRLQLPLNSLPEKKAIHSTRTMFDPPQIIQEITPSYLTLWTIHPNGEPLQGKPSSSVPLYMRCLNGEVTVSMMIVPN